MTAKKNPTAAEALAEKVPFVWHNTDFEITPSNDWSYEALEAYEEGRIVAFLKDVLGDEEHAKFKALKPKASEVQDFVETIQKALGIQGN